MWHTCFSLLERKRYYYRHLMMNYLGFDDDTIDFMDSLLDE